MYRPCITVHPKKNMDRCAQTLISDGDSLRRYVGSVHDALCLTDNGFEFEAAILWTADHADTTLGYLHGVLLATQPTFENKHPLVH